MSEYNNNNNKAHVMPHQSSFVLPTLPLPRLSDYIASDVTPASKKSQEEQARLLHANQLKEIHGLVQFINHASELVSPLGAKAAQSKRTFISYHQWHAIAFNKVREHASLLDAQHLQVRFTYLNPESITLYAFALLPKLLAWYQRLWHLLGWRQGLRWRADASVEQCARWRNRLRAHCSSMLVCINQLQQHFSRIMLQHLHCLQESGFSHSHLIWHVLASAQSHLPQARLSGKRMPVELEYVLNDERVEPALRPLTQTQFHNFQRYITRYGDRETQQGLQNLAWHQPERATTNRRRQPYLSLQRQNSSQGHFVIPRALQAWVPTRRWWPNWLFAGFNFRRDFFKTKQYLLAALQSLPRRISQTDEQGLSYADFMRYRSQLRHIEQLLQAEQKALHTKQAKYVFSFGSASTFLRKWRQELQRCTHHVDTLKAQLIEQALAVMVAQIKEDGFVSSWKAYDCACELAQTLRLERHKSHAKRVINAMFKVLAQQQSPQGRQHDGRAIMIIDKLTHHGTLTNADLRFVSMYFRTTAIANPALLQAIAKHRPGQVQLLSEYIVKQLQSIQATQLSKILSPLRIKRCIAIGHVVQAMGDKHAKQQLQRVLNRFALTVMQAYAQAAQHTPTILTSIVQIGQLMCELGSQIGFADSHLANYFLELQRLAKQKSRPALYVLASSMARMWSRKLGQDALEYDLQRLQGQLQTCWQQSSLSQHQRETLQTALTRVANQNVDLIPWPQVSGEFSSVERGLMASDKQQQLFPEIFHLMLGVKKARQQIKGKALDTANVLQINQTLQQRIAAVRDKGDVSQMGFGRCATRRHLLFRQRSYMQLATQNALKDTVAEFAPQAPLITQEKTHAYA